MEYKVEDISPVEKKVVISVPTEEANAAISAAIAMYKMRVDIKGFRKGKVPGSVVESRYGKQIYAEATTDLINVQINTIMGELGVVPLSGIKVDGEELKRDADYEYAISFEVAPRFDLPKYVGVTIEEEKAEVAEEEVNKVKERILENAAEVKVIEDVRKPIDGEIASISFVAYQDGKPVEGIRAENFDMPLGEGQSLPEFEEIVKTLTTGEDGEGDITFPEDFINTEFAGQTMTMKVKLHAIKERIVPEMSDEVAKKAGFESVEVMEKAIRESYASSRKQLNKSNAQKNAILSLLDGLDFPLPPTLVENRVERLAQDMVYRLERQGRSIQSLGKSPEEIRADLLPEAEESARTEIFLLAVANEEGLEIAPQEIDTALTKIAMQTKQPLHELKRYYEDNNLIAPLKDSLLCDKAMEFIYDNAEVVEVEAKTEEEASAKKKAPAKKPAAKKAAAKKDEEGEEKPKKKAPAKKAAKKADEDAE